MNKKMSAFFLAIILIFTLTGCMQFKVAMNVRNNYIDETKIQLTFNESFVKNLDKDGKELYEYWLEETSQTLGDTDFYDDLTVKPLYYEENGSKFSGTSYERFLGEDSGYPEEGEGFKIIQLNNNTYRLEVVLDEALLQDDIIEITEMDIEEIKQRLSTWGGKVQFIITTKSKVLSHNADEVINGEYIWDISSILFDTSRDKFIAFIEYKEDEKNSTVKKTKKEEPIKENDSSIDDPDFYGKALKTFNVLYGTDKGLELDSELLKLQGALIYARLLGLEEEIEDFAKANPSYDSGFTDVPEWAKPTMNYLIYNKLIYGEGNLYGSYDPMSEAQLAALILRALGYSEEDGDFVLADAPKKACELGFCSTYCNGFEREYKDRLTRRDMSYIVFNSLFVQNKAKTAHLIENLIK